MSQLSLAISAFAKNRQDEPGSNATSMSPADLQRYRVSASSAPKESFLRRRDVEKSYDSLRFGFIEERIQVYIFL
jgi:hypothetical protein